MNFKDKLDRILEKHSQLETKLSDHEIANSKDFIRLSKEFYDMGAIVDNINQYKLINNELANLKIMMEDISSDSELREMAEQELHQLKRVLPEVEKKLKLSLLPKDEVDAKNAILEVRAGTGGEEAALFASVLFNMYLRYADRQGWKCEVLTISETGIGGYKEASVSISGQDVFSKLKFESGVHRVQRVPETETSGRIHTSAATVAVLPEAEEVDIKIDDKDLRIDIFRASGPGGQSVNTTDSAVRIVHVPTGIMVQQQDEKSQHKNKAKAMKVLRARLYEKQREKVDSERAASRKSQVGSGDRSERIRTYNYPQGRVTDHRINLTLYKIDSIVNLGELNELIGALITEDEAKRLADSTE